MDVAPSSARHQPLSTEPGSCGGILSSDDYPAHRRAHEVVESALSLRAERRVRNRVRDTNAGALLGFQAVARGAMAVSSATLGPSSGACRSRPNVTAWMDQALKKD